MRSFVNESKKDQNDYDLIIIGGGQSALACGFYLRRTQIKYLILDQQSQSGGAWIHGWDSLSLFSPAEFSSLPGFMFPKSENYYPVRDEVISYMDDYQVKYSLPVKRSVLVTAVLKQEGGFTLKTSIGDFKAKTVISATGTWASPFIPVFKGLVQFKNEQLHSAYYKNASDFIGKKVLVIGGGNSGAQILAEVSKYTAVTWSTIGAPAFLPDDVDGRVLFDVATQKYNEQKAGNDQVQAKYNVRSIVMVPPVVDARGRDVLNSKGEIERFTETGVVWKSGEEENFDVVIWCTGFKPALKHLEPLGILQPDGRVNTSGSSKVEGINGLWLVGYGDWTGFASATLIGVGRSARSTMEEVVDFLKL